MLEMMTMVCTVVKNNSGVIQVSGSPKILNIYIANIFSNAPKVQIWALQKKNQFGILGAVKNHSMIFFLHCLSYLFDV